MSNETRREFLQAAAVGTTLLAGWATLPASAAEATLGGPAFNHAHMPLPLPYAPNALEGLSEQLVQSHWQNNYGGAVTALNTVRARLAQALADDSVPPYVYNGLKREQLLRTGSVVLHELYFANLGGNGAAAADLRTRIAGSFGSFDAWESEFRKIALGLGGGSGWVVLGHNRQLDLLENYWMADHATAPADTTPVLVMDMYEHAYHMDFGAATARYVDAFFANINWETVAARI